MGKEKKNFEDVLDLKSGSGSRARNKTVMLTPDIANQMRSRIDAGAHRSGSTEKIDSAILDEIRAEYANGASENPLDAIAKKLESAASKGNESSEEASTTIVESDEPVVGMTLDELISKEESEVDNAVLEIPEDQPEDQEETLDIADEDNSVDLGNEVDALIASTGLESSVTIEDEKVEEAEIEEVESELAVEPVAAAKPPSAASAVKAAASASGEVSKSSNGDTIRWEKDGPLCGFLVTFDGNPNGDYFVLRAGRLIVSSEDSGKGNLLLINDESVSPMHAIIRVAEGSVLVLDQLSENGTRIERGEEVNELSGDKSSLLHGDVIYFGERSYKVCLLA